jgi:hypothetical protein
MSNEHRVTEEFNCHMQLIQLRFTLHYAKIGLNFLEYTTPHAFLEFHETMVTVHITVAREHIVKYVF